MSVSHTGVVVSLHVVSFQTAKRELAEECGSGLTTCFLSRSPCAFMSYHYIEPGCSVGAKVRSDH